MPVLWEFENQKIKFYNNSLFIVKTLKGNKNQNL